MARRCTIGMGGAMAIDWNAIGDLLAVYGIHEGFAENRKRLAISLHEAGFSEDDVGDLLASMRRSGARAPAMAKVLSSPEQARARLADIRHCAALREARRPPIHTPSPPVPKVRLQESQKWDEADTDYRIVCRMRDVLDADRVASELGVPVTRVKEVWAKSGH